MINSISQITQLWVEQEYHHKSHRDIGTTPIKRFVESPPGAGPTALCAMGLSEVQLLDPNTPNALCPLYPIDKSANAQGVRRTLEPVSDAVSYEPSDAPSSMAAPQWPPLLKQMLTNFVTTGLPPAMNHLPHANQLLIDCPDLTESDLIDMI